MTKIAKFEPTNLLFMKIDSALGLLIILVIGVVAGVLMLVKMNSTMSMLSQLTMAGTIEANVVNK
jgi:hypothetical protein